MYQKILALVHLFLYQNWKKAVIDELNCLSREYLNKDELEQKVQFNNNLQEQKKSVENEISIYEKKDF